MYFTKLREANAARQAAWCPDPAEQPDLMFRAVELGGESGEVLNVVKKLERERRGWRGSRDTVEHLLDELADVVICADLTALAAGHELGPAIVRKFNETSRQNGFNIFIGLEWNKDGGIANPTPDDLRAAADRAEAIGDPDNSADWLRGAAKSIEDAKTWGLPDGPRLCVNCGKTAGPEVKRGSRVCGDCENGYHACTHDMTYDEAMDEIKKLRSELFAIDGKHR